MIKIFEDGVFELDLTGLPTDIVIY